jgi:hypothetical protein
VARLRRSARVLLLPAGLYVALLADWRGAAPTPPVSRRAFVIAAPLEAGAATVRLSPPLPVVRGGYGLRRAVADRERDPLHVRAVALRSGERTVAIVLADLVLVPEELTCALEGRVADLKLDGLVLAATHTHSSVGAYDPRPLAQVVGMGRYRADVTAALLDRAEQAVRLARARLVPVGIRTAESRVAGWAENRSTAGGEVDDALTAVELESQDGATVATLAVVAAHPTLFPRTAPQLSADYPGVAMRQLEAAGGVALLFQGAHGDARPPGKGTDAIEAAGTFVAQRVGAALRDAHSVESRLGLSEVEVVLPPAELQAVHSFLVRRPASNLLELFTPRTVRVAAVTLGDLTMLALPGEPTALAARRLVAGLPAGALSGRKVRVVALAGGYLGYIDTPERVRAGQGEARRAWFGPELIDVLAGGLSVAVRSQGGLP